jgi:hypothetical protein
VRRQILYPMLVVLFVAMIWFFFSKTNAMISDIKQADFALSATDVIMLAANGYLQEHGQWPSSWKDVESCPIKHGRYSWPDDMDDIKNIEDFVTIDFSLPLDEIGKQQGKGFTAIRSKDAANPGSFRYKLLLLDTIHKLQAKATQEKAAAENALDEKPAEEKSVDKNVGTPREATPSN